MRSSPSKSERTTSTTRPRMADRVLLQPILAAQLWKVEVKCKQRLQHSYPQFRGLRILIEAETHWGGTWSNPTPPYGRQRDAWNHMLGLETLMHSGHAEGSYSCCSKLYMMWVAHGLVLDIKLEHRVTFRLILFLTVKWWYSLRHYPHSRRRNRWKI